MDYDLTNGGTTGRITQFDSKTFSYNARGRLSEVDFVLDSGYEVNVSEVGWVTCYPSFPFA